MIRTFLLFFFFPFLCLTASEEQRICLNMIVKDESQVIRRCLDSVKSLIDYWVIVDTGSSDGTQEIIQKHFKDIPGELYERPWKNWGDTRTEALELAKGKGDYILFMDADDTLKCKEGFQWPLFDKDLYTMWRGTENFTYLKPQLVRDDVPWKWIGVTHEYLGCDQPFTSETLQNVQYISGEGGASYRDPQKKFWKNVALLTEALKTEPENVRYVFYLAESYRDAGEKAKALEWFLKRVCMGGWDEEVYWSKLQASIILRDLNAPKAVVIESFKDAHNCRLHRVEPIYYLAEIYNQERDYEKAYECLKTWAFIPQPEIKDSLFNMSWMEEYGLLFQLSICSYYLGHYEESLNICEKLLAHPKLPEGWRALVESNRSYPLAKLTEKTDKQVQSIAYP